MTDGTLEGVDVTNDNLKGTIVTHYVDNEKYDLQNIRCANNVLYRSFLERDLTVRSITDQVAGQDELHQSIFRIES